MKAAAEALKALKEGNSRFVSGLKSSHSNTTQTRRIELAEKGQQPHTIILSCSDSRAPGELIFDVGLGELFVIRVAGNIVAPSLLASAEFAVMNFSTPLMVVMGHTQCGAINAACRHAFQPKDLPSPAMEDLVSQIGPAIRHAGPPKDPDLDRDYVKRVTWENVRHSMARLANQSRIIGDRIGRGQLVVVGAVYDIETGLVTFADDIN